MLSRFKDKNKNTRTSFSTSWKPYPVCNNGAGRHFVLWHTLQGPSPYLYPSKCSGLESVPRAKNGHFWFSAETQVTIFSPQKAVKIFWASGVLHSLPLPSVRPLDTKGLQTRGAGLRQLDCCGGNGIAAQGPTVPECATTSLPTYLLSYLS